MKRSVSVTMPCPTPQSSLHKSLQCPPATDGQRHHCPRPQSDHALPRHHAPSRSPPIRRSTCIAFWVRTLTVAALPRSPPIHPHARPVRVTVAVGVLEIGNSRPPPAVRETAACLGFAAPLSDAMGARITTPLDGSVPGMGYGSRIPLMPDSTKQLSGIRLLKKRCVRHQYQFLLLIKTKRPRVAGRAGCP